MLIGFFVLVQATDRQALAKGLREGFGGKWPTVRDRSDSARCGGGHVLPGSAHAASARVAPRLRDRHLRDPRATLRVAAGPPGRGRRPGTGSADLLATDRARATVAWLIAHGVAADRIMIAPPGTGRRIALVTVSFTGDPAQEKTMIRSILIAPTLVASPAGGAQSFQSTT